MSEPMEYQIERVADILAVPQEKWPALLSDLRESLVLRLAIKPLVDAGLMEADSNLVWCDAGIAGVSKLEIEVVDSLNSTGGQP